MSLLQLDTELPASHEANSIEGSLKSLWDKIHSVVELINVLKSENASLQEQHDRAIADFQDMKAQYESQLSTLRNQYEHETVALKTQKDDETASLKLYYEHELATLRSNAESLLQSTRSSLESALQDTRVQLEAELNILKNQLSVKEQDMKRLRAEYAQIVNANEHGAFTREEKEILRNRIRDLIAKINSHL